MHHCFSNNSSQHPAGITAPDPTCAGLLTFPIFLHPQTPAVTQSHRSPNLASCSCYKSLLRISWAPSSASLRAPPGLAGRTAYSLALASSLLVQPMHPFAMEKPLLVWCLGSQWHRGSGPASTSTPKDPLHPHSHHICNSLQGRETIP